MNGECFEPSPELQGEIDAALEERRESRKNKDWTSGKGVVLDPEFIRERAARRSVPMARSFSSIGPDPDSFSYAPGQVITVDDFHNQLVRLWNPTLGEVIR